MLGGDLGTSLAVAVEYGGTGSTTVGERLLSGTEIIFEVDGGGLGGGCSTSAPGIGILMQGDALDGHRRDVSRSGGAEG